MDGEEIVKNASFCGSWLLVDLQFFLARHQGKSPPRLHKARVEENRVNRARP